MQSEHAEIAQKDLRNRERNRHLRALADWLARAFARIDAVQRVALFGSVAAPARRQSPHARRLRRFGDVTRKCDDLDLAVWVSDLTSLGALQRARNVTARDYFLATRYGLADHMVDTFIMEPQTDRYLGRLCQFNDCPRPGKIECLILDCGSPAHLRRDIDFVLDPGALASERSFVLFDRHAATGTASERADGAL